MTIPFFTSIPPSLSRTTKSGEEIGEDYAMRCIESWRNSGFQIHSVNSASEISTSDTSRTASSKLHEVRYIPIDRDARKIAGKPLVFLADLLQQAAPHSNDAIVIANSDLLIELPPPFRKLLKDCSPAIASSQNALILMT